MGKIPVTVLVTDTCQGKDGAWIIFVEHEGISRAVLADEQRPQIGDLVNCLFDPAERELYIDSDTGGND